MAYLVGVLFQLFATSKDSSLLRIGVVSISLFKAGSMHIEGIGGTIVAASKLVSMKLFCTFVSKLTEDVDGPDPSSSLYFLNQDKTRIGYRYNI